MVKNTKTRVQLLAAGHNPHPAPKPPLCIVNHDLSSTIWMHERSIHEVASQNGRFPFSVKFGKF